MNIIKLKGIVCAFTGFLGGALSMLMGGFTEDMTTLAVLMVLDFITGIMVAGVFKKSSKTKGGALESKAGFKGICKKCVILFFVLMAHRLDMALGVSYIRTVTIIGFITNEAISIVENAGIMGVPLPDSIKKAIEILSKKEVM